MCGNLLFAYEGPCPGLVVKGRHDAGMFHVSVYRNGTHDPKHDKSCGSADLARHLGRVLAAGGC